MFCQKYRPQKFSEVVGQKLPVSMMKSVVLHPETSPRCYIFEGSFGSGKTSLSRVFSKALNCKDKDGIEPCLKCDVCKDSSLFSPWYQEYDVSQVGNVDFMRDLKDKVSYSRVSEGYRVIVLDECHSASRQSLTALLKITEEVPEKTFFILNTTEVDKIIPTIRSRSVELSFQAVSEHCVLDVVNKIVEKEKISISEYDIRRIVEAAEGHVRNALMLLELYVKVEVEDFRNFAVRSIEKDFVSFMMFSLVKDLSGATQALEKILEVPSNSLRGEIESSVLKLLKGYIGLGENEVFKALLEKLGNNVFILPKFFSSSWVSNSYKSSLNVQSVFWTLFYELSRLSVKSEVTLERYKK